jgi:hypothetical protein
MVFPVINGVLVFSLLAEGERERSAAPAGGGGLGIRVSVIAREERFI